MTNEEIEKLATSLMLPPKHLEGFKAGIEWKTDNPRILTEDQMMKAAFGGMNVTSYEEYTARLDGIRWCDLYHRGKL